MNVKSGKAQKRITEMRVGWVEMDISMMWYKKGIYVLNVERAGLEAMRTNYVIHRQREKKICVINIKSIITCLSFLTN